MNLENDTLSHSRQGASEIKWRFLLFGHFFFLGFFNTKCRIQIYLRKSRTVSVLLLWRVAIFTHAANFKHSSKRVGRGSAVSSALLLSRCEEYRHWIDIISSYTNLNDRTLAHSSLGPSFLGGWCGVVVTRSLLVWSMHVAST